MKKQKVTKFKLVKVQLSDNLFKYEKVKVIEECLHHYDEKLTETNSLGTWRTCSKCRSTKLSL